MTNKKTKAERKPKQIRLVWGSPEELPVLYTNHLQVTHAGEKEFYIFFGHATPPLTYGLDVDEIPDEIIIKPITKLVLTPETMRNVIDVLSENLAKYEEKREKEEKK